MRNLNREDPIVCGLIQLIRAEGESSKYLKVSAKQLYNIYEPLQAYNLDLTTYQTADYKRFNNFWVRLRLSLRTEFEQETVDLPTKNSSNALLETSTMNPEFFSPAPSTQPEQHVAQQTPVVSNEGCRQLFQQPSGNLVSFGTGLDASRSIQQVPTPSNHHHNHNHAQYNMNPPPSFDNEVRSVSTLDLDSVNSAISSINSNAQGHTTDDHFKWVIKEYAMKSESNFVNADDMNQKLIHSEMAEEIYRDGRDEAVKQEIIELAIAGRMKSYTERFRAEMKRVTVVFKKFYNQGTGKTIYLQERSLVELETEHYEQAYIFHEKKMKEYEEKIKANNALIHRSDANMTTCWDERKYFRLFFRLR